MNLIKNICLLLVLIFSCCKLTSKDEKTISLNKLEVEFKATICQKSKDLPLKEAILKYGKPIKNNEFVVDDISLNEFRINLYNVFSKEDILKKEIVLKEVTWKCNNDSLVTVWYKEKLNNNWLSVYKMKYGNSDEF